MHPPRPEVRHMSRSTPLHERTRGSRRDPDRLRRLAHAAALRQRVRRAQRGAHAAGLFDLSHMGEIFVTGPQAGEALDYALVGHLSALAPAGPATP